MIFQIIKLQNNRQDNYLQDDYFGGNYFGHIIFKTLIPNDNYFSTIQTYVWMCASTCSWGERSLRREGVRVKPLPPPLPQNREILE